MKKTLPSVLALIATAPALAQNQSSPANDAQTVTVTASRSGQAQPLELLGASVTEHLRCGVTFGRAIRGRGLHVHHQAVAVAKA